MNNLHLDLTQKLGNHVFLTDGGMETDLIFNKGIDLPCFASFDLLSTQWGREALKQYYKDYLDLAARHQVGFILETPTWRANPDWGEKLGYDGERLAEANRQSVELLRELGEAHPLVKTRTILISGNIGPRGDGYVADARMTSEQSRQYHSQQIKVFAGAKVDLVSAFTINYIDEALGIVQAARDFELPVVISYTLETDGNLPSGETLADAIVRVDNNTLSYPLYYMINCAHPTHFESILAVDEQWKQRIRGLRGNASKCSHAELDEAEVLDDGNPQELGSDYHRLQTLLPNLQVLGGCCGTDIRHVEQIASSCLGHHH